MNNDVFRLEMGQWCVNCNIYGISCIIFINEGWSQVLSEMFLLPFVILKVSMLKWLNAS